MIAGPNLRSGSGGGGSVSITSTDSNESNQDYSVTSVSDPVFGGGKTGSEVMAEAGDPSSVATIDSDASSVQEKMQQDGISSTVETFKDLAKDGNDSNDAATFDQVDQSNADDLKQGVSELAGAAQDVASSSGGSSGPANGNQSFAQNRAAHAAATGGAGAGGGSSSGPGGLLEAVVSFLVSLVRTLFGGQ